MPIFEIAAALAALAVLVLAFWWLGSSREPDAPALGEISQQWLVQHRAHERDPRAY